MDETTDQRGIKGFLDRGGFWALMAVLVVYFPIYLAVSWIGGRLKPEGGVFDSPAVLFFSLTFGLLVMAALLTLFTAWMGWNKDIYGRQPVYRSWWMWLGPILVTIPIVMRVLGIDWGGRALSITLLMLGTGLLIGYVEELLFRGVGVRMMRAGGHREFAVAVTTSVLFGLSHGTNIFSGQPLTTVAVTVGYTIPFGVCMYLTMRSFGFILPAMILHGLTDPTTFLATGGIDEVGANVSAIAQQAGNFTYLVLAPLGYLLVLFVRGKAGEPRHRRSDVAAPEAPVSA